MDRVTYEVITIVRDDLCEMFESFMIEAHIPEVMATGAFLSAFFSTLEAGRYRASYVAQSQEALAKYLVEHSPRLRADVAERFPEGVEFSREEWKMLASF